MEGIIRDLKAQARPERVGAVARFFKTGKGEYGEGDVFWGICVPEVRRVGRQHLDTPFPVLTKLLKHSVHECRLAALLILVEQFQKGDGRVREQIFRFYLANTEYINNWDLVDLSADKIVGEYLFGTDKTILRKLAQSKKMWERRIAIVATFAFIKKGKFAETFKIARMLLKDRHDLIHKATGWMLREVGKRNIDAEERFLRKYYCRMPRTMLRYAIERFPREKQKRYLKK